MMMHYPFQHPTLSQSPLPSPQYQETEVSMLAEHNSLIASFPPPPPPPHVHTHLILTLAKGYDFVHQFSKIVLGLEFLGSQCGRIY